MSEPLRLDHYLFRSRLFKSRSQATAACKDGKLYLNDQPAKASSEVHAGDLLKLRERGLYRHLRVLELPGKNMPKDQAKATWRDETPEDIRSHRELLELATRGRGAHQEGPRPSKKERRDLRKLRGH